MVKFLTAEACQKYFEETEKGVVFGSGEKKTVVFVEKSVSPNSSNKFIDAAVRDGATRCVQAIGADESLSETFLMELARGKAQRKREMDRIRHGTTSSGVSHFERSWNSFFSFHSLLFHFLRFSLKTCTMLKLTLLSHQFHYIEFRFANITDSISFLRDLRNKEAWEHCYIKYAPDPCELAKGVHFEDTE